MAYHAQGDRFEKYVLEQFLGEGASAEVWQVRDENGEAYALKIFAPSSGLDDLGKQLFFTDYERMAELHHPNILEAIRGGTFGDKPFILMPLCEHGSLMKELRERVMKARQRQEVGRPFFREEELAPLVLQVADALMYLRHNGVIHMDVKPDNVLILQNRGRRQYVLSDFGISVRVRRTILKQTRQRISADAGMAPAYAAPEVYKGEISSKSDVFSLGVMLYELANGDTPYVPSGVGIGMAMLNGAAIPVLDGDFSQRFVELLTACLAFKPEDRCSAEDLHGWARHFISRGGWPPVVMQPGDPVISQPLPIGEGSEIDPPAPEPEGPGEAEGPPRPGGGGVKTPRRYPWMLVLGLLLLAGAGWWGIRAYQRFRTEQIAVAYWQAGDLPAAARHYDILCARTSADVHCDLANRIDSLRHQFVEMSPFTHGLARVGREDTLPGGVVAKRYGYVSEDGIMVVPVKYADGGGFNTSGLAMVAEDQAGRRFYGMIDRAGTVQVPIRYQQLIVRPDLAIGDLRDTFYFANLNSVQR